MPFPRPRDRPREYKLDCFGPLLRVRFLCGTNAMSSTMAPSTSRHSPPIYQSLDRATVLKTRDHCIDRYWVERGIRTAREPLIYPFMNEPVMDLDIAVIADANSLNILVTAPSHGRLAIKRTGLNQGTDPFCFSHQPVDRIKWAANRPHEGIREMDSECTLSGWPRRHHQS